MEKSELKPSLTMACLTVFVPLVSIMVLSVILKINIMLAMIVAAGIASIFGLVIGFSWAELQNAMFRAINQTMIAIVILLLVGILIGVWILSGTIPFLLYWGLRILTPSTFLVGAFIFCAIFSVTTGTSFGTMGTGGLALMGVGLVLGLPASLIGGAIISGAYFGDKMSPLSETNNATAAITNTNLFSHIASMIYTTGPATIIAGILYAILGSRFSGTMPSNVGTVLQTMQGHFNLNIFLLIPPVTLAVLAYRKVPPVPTLIISIIAGAIVALIAQGATIHAVMNAAYSGFVSKTGIAVVDHLLTTGGITSMFFNAVFLIVLVPLGGVLEHTRSLKVIVDALLARVRTSGGLILTVVVSTYLLLFGTGSNFICYIVLGRAYVKPFEERGIQSRVLSRTLDDVGTLSVPLVPWSLSAMVILTLLKVHVGQFAPYAFLLWITPIFTLIYGFTGFAIFKIPGAPTAVAAGKTDYAGEGVGSAPK